MDGQSKMRAKRLLCENPKPKTVHHAFASKCGCVPCILIYTKKLQERMFRIKNNQLTVRFKKKYCWVSKFPSLPPPPTTLS